MYHMHTHSLIISKFESDEVDNIIDKLIKTKVRMYVHTFV